MFNSKNTNPLKANLQTAINNFYDIYNEAYPPDSDMISGRPDDINYILDKAGECLLEYALLSSDESTFDKLKESVDQLNETITTFFTDAAKGILVKNREWYTNRGKSSLEQISTTASELLKAVQNEIQVNVTGTQGVEGSEASKPRSGSSGSNTSSTGVVSPPTKLTLKR